MGWGWFLLEAATSLALGMLIFVNWPSGSVWAIGTLVGVAVLMVGIARVVVAVKIRSGVSSVKPFPSCGVGVSNEPPNTQRSVS
ncbi:MAG TPA: hypothetical protein VEI01_22590 [Terriglobales bacterium]|nr:hypothetical protein [Terriglobales bacterium]